MQCDEIFAEAPIVFKPRKGNALDERIAQLIIQYNVRIPIVHIKDSLYLIGSNRLICILKQDNVVIRVGGGNDMFENYVQFNHRTFERILVTYMINSEKSLDWVVD